jgi:hypothetical protein
MDKATTTPKYQGNRQPQPRAGSSDPGENVPLLDDNFPPDSQLVAEGWERRFMTDSERAKESTDLYTALGFDVRAEPVIPTELGAECTDCRLIVCRSFITIYTRSK